MAWVSVHQGVDGPKLRRLYRTIGCSKFEALGILNFLWFFGMGNADENGLVQDADLDVLNRYLYGCGDMCTLDIGKVVQALVDVGWIDVAENGFIIHDWDVWQEQWYKAVRTRKNDAERKRKAREEEKLKQSAPVKHEESTEKAEPRPQKKPKTEPEKKTYAEYVKMTEANYARLVELYGKEFTDMCVTELDLYKGSTGKRYKDDYRAILSWVVDRVKGKHPGLLERSKSAQQPTRDENPFAEWGGLNV